MMSGIRCANTKPEIHIRSLIHRQGFRFRLHVRDLPGVPDIVLLRFRAVIFVHGCFWHGHDCHLFKMPSTRREFWDSKIVRNRENDQRVVEALHLRGWRVATVWECTIKGRSKLDDNMLAERLAVWLRHGHNDLELSASNRGKN